MKRAAVGLLAALMLVLAACGPKPPAEFAIYLTGGDDAPILSMSDIVSYTWGAHEIRLTPEAFARLMALRVPTQGLPFAARVNGKTAYTGAFWTPISSQSFDGVTIVLPLGAQEPIIQIELGYPSPAFFRGRDPRSNTEVRRALERAGKLQ